MLLCPICQSDSTMVAYGVLAPWILELTHQDFVETNLLNCTTCEFTYFSHRFSDFELEKLYSEYRNDSYFTVRNKWEPWYRPSINNAYKGSSTAVDVRVEFMTKIIKSTGCRRLGTVIDIGGDEGQFFPEIPTENRLVIDLSNKPLREGVSRISSLSEFVGDVEFIIAAHILEHVNDPVNFVAELCDRLPKEGMLYLEVPLDLPKVREFHKKENYQRYLLKLSQKTRTRRVLVDFVTGLNRQFGRHIPHHGLVKESEHINYFSEKSLKIILGKNGMTEVALNSEPDAKTGGLRLGKLGILAKKLS